MSFQSPGLLLGLWLALLPIAIHLLFRRKPTPRLFPALELLIRSAVVTQRRARLRRLLLLLFRMLILSLFALAASRPLLGRSESKPGGTRKRPTALIIVVDDSLSMRAIAKKRSHFAKAKEYALKTIEQLRPSDSVNIVFSSTPQTIGPPHRDYEKVKQLLLRRTCSYRHNTLDSALTAARSTLLQKAKAGEGAAGGTASEKKILVVSDLARHAISPGAWDDSSEVKLEFARVSAAALDNYALTVAAIADKEEIGPVRITARVQDFSVKNRPSRTLEVGLQTQGGLESKGIVEIENRSSADKVFDIPDGSPSRGIAKIVLPDDPLDEDNARWIPFETTGDLRLLIADGDPSSHPKEDEIYFLEKALSVDTTRGQPPQIIYGDELSQADLGTVDVLVLAGLPSLNKNQGLRIRDFVSAGGGVFVSMSPATSPSLFSPGLRPLLGRGLRSLKVSTRDEPYQIQQLQNTHPILSVFDNSSRKSLLRSQVSGIFLLQSKNEPQVAPLLVLNTGAPLMIERTLGKGRVILFTSSIDRDLGDLPIRPSFVPLINRTMRRLAGQLDEKAPRVRLVGEPHSFGLGAYQSLRIVSPDKKTTVVRKRDDGTGVYSNTEMPGIYRVFSGEGSRAQKLPELDFVVNVDSRESTLDYLTTKQVQALLTGQPNTEEPKPILSNLLGTLVPGQNFASMLLVLLLLAYVVESLLANLPRRTSPENRDRSRHQKLII